MLEFLSFIIGPNLVFVLGATVLMLTRWISGPSPGESRSIGRSCVRTLAWTLLGVGFVISSAFSLGVGMLLVGSIVVIIAMIYGKQAATQQYAMLALLGAATERSMPLEGVFAAFGNERGGWMQDRTRRIAHLLLDGIPLPVAIGKVPGVLPPETVPLVRVGYDTGSLPGAIRQAIATRNFFEPVWQNIVPKILYVCIFPGMATGLVAFMAIKIVPQFQKIFKDFNMRLPEVTQWLFGAGEMSTLLIWLLALGWIGTTFLAAYVLLRYVGSIRWDVPGAGWLLRRRYAATILDGLALAAERQKPFIDAVMQMAIGFPKRAIANRLWNAYGMMESGENDLEALRRVGLLFQADVALLRTAERSGNIAWAARELADSHRRRLFYRTYALVQTIFPPIICVYAAVVVLVWGALFTPLISLIQHLAPASP